MQLRNWIQALALAGLTCTAWTASADDGLEPYGTAANHMGDRYKNLRIVIDAEGASTADMNFDAMVAERILDHPGAKVVMVIEGPQVRFFAKNVYTDYQGVVDRVAALKKRGVKIEFCGNSVKASHLQPDQMVGVGMVGPGAFPQIARYEMQGYAMVKPIRAALFVEKGK